MKPDEAVQKKYEALMVEKVEIPGEKRKNMFHYGYCSANTINKTYYHASHFIIVLQQGRSLGAKFHAVSDRCLKENWIYQQKEECVYLYCSANLPPSYTIHLVKMKIQKEVVLLQDALFSLHEAAPT